MPHAAKFKALRRRLRTSEVASPFSHKCLALAVNTPLLAPYVRFGDILALQPSSALHIGSIIVAEEVANKKQSVGLLIYTVGKVQLYRPMEAVKLLEPGKFQAVAYVSGIAYSDAEFKTVLETQGEPLKICGPRPDLYAPATIRLKQLKP